MTINKLEALEMEYKEKLKQLQTRLKYLNEKYSLSDISRVYKISNSVLTQIKKGNIRKLSSVNKYLTILKK